MFSSVRKFPNRHSKLKPYSEIKRYSLKSDAILKSNAILNSTATLKLNTTPGAFIARRPWCISPSLFQISPSVLEKISDCGKFSQFYLFPTNFSIFIRQHFWRSFFLYFRIFPLFFLLQYISPCFAKIIIFTPTFTKLPLFSKNSRVFYMLYVYFVSPYFDHDAFMHHTMHVLDAPAPL